MLEFKSKLNHEFDYHTVDLSGYEPKTFVFDEYRYERDLQRILKRYGEKKEADIVEKGDLVVLSMNGSSDCYRKSNISVLMGKHMAPEALEDAMIGMPKGNRTVVLDDEKVELVIHSITRTVLPPLEDHIVASWRMDGINSVSELRKYLVGRQIDDFFIECEEGEDCTAQISMKLKEAVEIRMDEEEEQLLRKEIEQKTKIHVSDEEEEDKDFDMAGFMEQIVRNSFLLALLGQEELRKKGMLYDESKYEEYVTRWMQTDTTKTRDEIVSEHPLFGYMLDEYAGYYIELLDKYVVDFYKSVINV